MELSSEYLDENVIKQLSTIDEKKSQSSQLLKYLRIEDFPVSEDNESILKKLEQVESKSYTLAAFAESLEQVRRSFSLIHSEIEIKKCKSLNFDSRLNRVSENLEKSFRKTDLVTESLASLELRLKDYSSASDYFLKFFEGMTQDAEIRIQELTEKLAKIEEKAENQANPEKQVCPRKSRDEGKLILSIKSPKSRPNRLN